MNVKKIKPLFTKFVCTADKYIEAEAMQGGIIDTSKMKTGLREYQKVVAVGTACRSLEEGMIVCINPDRYAQRQFSPNSVKNDLMTNQVTRYNFPMVTMDGIDYLLLDEADVEFIVLEFEE